ncbi:unnamed protein product [Leptosia nina]|uniref:C2H2-type domain-containing protein n=1 Tax=Leptosia nina TaxID=320188 RepID=A0AAV1JQ10_9NEOP
MPPKRKRGRPRRRISQSLTFEQQPENATSDKNTSGIENISKKVIEYICSHCDKSFKRKLHLEWHLKICGQNEDADNTSGELGNDSKENLLRNYQNKRQELQCDKCSKVFVFKKSFLKHIENEHAEGPNSVKCDLCEASCPSVEILERHNEKRHNVGSFKCEYCNQTFVRKAHVKRHMMQKGCDGRNLVNFSCGICNAKFTRKDNLMVHLRLQHITKKLFPCKLCQYYTSNFSKLIIHTQKVHCPKPLQYECDYCGKLTSSRASIMKHLEIHGDKKYACGVCGYSTFTIEVMRRHALTHVRNKPYKCNICKKSYIQRAQLVKHLERHMSYTCSTCGIQTRLKEEMEVHEQLHKDDGNLSCYFEDCTASNFKTKRELEKHIKEHTNVYECEVCHKAFKSDTNKRRHVATHALDRPRRCMYCVNARAYVRGEHLLRHVRKHHADVFKQRLMHVRKVLGSYVTTSRVSKSELEAVLNVLDAETDRIIEDYGTGVLYGGLQDTKDGDIIVEAPLKREPSTLLSEEELAENLKALLSKLIEHDLLLEFGWPDEPIDEILEKVIENCGANAADRTKWSRVQCLRENTKHLFLYVIEDKDIAKMLTTHTIDQVIMHILEQVNDTA